MAIGLQLRVLGDLVMDKLLDPTNSVRIISAWKLQEIPIMMFLFVVRLRKNSYVSLTTLTIFWLFFDHLPLCVDIFYDMNFDKK